jgi:hypothetical protein
MLKKIKTAKKKLALIALKETFAVKVKRMQSYAKTHGLRLQGWSWGSITLRSSGSAHQVSRWLCLAGPGLLSPLHRRSRSAGNADAPYESPLVPPSSNEMFLGLKDGLSRMARSMALGRRGKPELLDNTVLHDRVPWDASQPFKVKVLSRCVHAFLLTACADRWHVLGPCVQILLLAEPPLEQNQKLFSTTTASAVPGEKSSPTGVRSFRRFKPRSALELAVELLRHVKRRSPALKQGMVLHTLYK